MLLQGIFTVGRSSFPFVFKNLGPREVFSVDCTYTLITSSPRYPQINGQSEDYVGIAIHVGLFKKTYTTGKDPYLARLEYRTTPIIGLLYSPLQLLMSRKLWDIIQTDLKLLKPSVPENAEINSKNDR